MTEQNPNPATSEKDAADAAPTGSGSAGSTRQELEQLTQRGALPRGVAVPADADSLFGGSPVLAPPGDATGILWPAEAARRPATPPRPDVPGYEIIDVLGSGGMGVVYRARQLKLGRLVALKMMLSGAHDAEQLTRFATEAQAVAELHHPNIVQIYEVGEHAGLPYFSLEFIGGGSLGHKSAGKPQPAEFAARIVDTLARAIHCAHLKNIVHRDLKPSNVLLTEDGTPKITDFGLAKRMESPAGLTRTGVVLGTPSYMAPEQARGEIRLIGPRADVYALGAILYELVTGRPPFVAASEMDTVMQVVLDEPVPPRRLQPKLPPDIDTICLKCLEKEPEKRYDTAEALAEDLRRFLSGEPITARPVSAPERLWRLCKRNPWLAGTTAAFFALLLFLAIAGPIQAVREMALKNRAETNEAAAKQARLEAEKERDDAKRAREVAEEERDRATYNQGVAARRFAETVFAYDRLARGVQQQIPDTPETRGLKANLLSTATDALLKIAAEPDSRPIVDPVMATAYIRLGGLFEMLGRTDKSLVAYQHAHRIRRALVDAKPGDVDLMANLALSHNRLAQACIVLEQVEEARTNYETALSLFQVLPKNSRSRAQLDGNLATSHTGLGLVFRQQNDPVRAREHFHEALQIRLRLASQSPKKDLSAKRSLLTAYANLGEFSLHVKDVGDALAQFTLALEQARRIEELSPDDASARTQAQTDLAACQARLGRAYLASNDPQKAHQEFARAVALLKPLAAREPGNMPMRSAYALALARSGQHVEAAVEAAEIRKLNPTHAAYLYNVACCFSLCVEYMTRQHNPESDGGLRNRYTETALSALAAAVENGYGSRPHLDIDPDLDAIRQHPEFQVIIDRMRREK